MTLASPAVHPGAILELNIHLTAARNGAMGPSPLQVCLVGVWRVRVECLLSLAEVVLQLETRSMYVYVRCYMLWYAPFPSFSHRDG